MKAANKVGRAGASQFPFWDFGECNQKHLEIANRPNEKLSIPFLGFRPMQQMKKETEKAYLIRVELSIPFLGFH